MKKNNSVRTVLIISVGFSIIYLFFDIKWALYTALLVGMLGIISDKVCSIIDFLWMKLAKVLSYIIPNILLTIVFYLFLFPISLLSKIFGAKNGLQMKNKDNSLWLSNNREIDKLTFEKMW